MADTVLSSVRLSYQYPQGVKLDFPDIHIVKNQHSLLLGDSGTGKTTLLHLLSGLSRPTTGEVHLMNQSLYTMRGTTLDAFRAKNLGFIFQEAHLLRNLTVTENIKLAQSLAKNPVDEQAIIELLDYLQLKDKAHVLPSQLSRGQKQRVAIARAVINRPGLLLADEPTASLDDTNTDLVLQLLFNIASNYGSTLLIATHDKRIKDQFANSYQL
ncbi:ATP-binding cassette domain-containing protein [Sphingobacterium phlebotomi]|uniref:ATP-binding cassette domain-containing protein n=1 Tax=Sphingobacterium phlebotomi TaxID=2605433 RepID=A0A5D4H9W2_9SPHI|nr:ATP-binding cassette domain-containing protein [Sphingobacterium phlebotomi]TYR35570.1 ATP-binding cassette domain-containing protein [Sphingobacterium phlebotomi]